MAGAPPLVVVLRAALVVGAAAALVFGLRVAGRPPAAAGVYYHCPMHPSVVARAPGSCPLCGMALVAGVRPPPAGPVLAGMERVQRLNLVRAPRAPAWVDPDGRILALGAPEDLLALQGTGATFRAAADPRLPIRVRGSGGGDTRDAEATGTSSFTVLRPGTAPPAGTVGWVEGPEESRPELVVSAAAVLTGPEGTHVVALAKDGTLRRRSFQAGRTVLGFTTVVSGLAEGERVVGREAFFADLALGPQQAGGDPGPAR